MSPTSLTIITISQSIFDLIILIFVIIKMSQIINAQTKAEKDINELWKAYRLFKSMIYGSHNRLIAKLASTLSRNEIHTDFSDTYLKDE